MELRWCGSFPTQQHSSQRLKFIRRWEKKLSRYDSLTSFISFSISENFSDQRRTSTTQISSLLEPEQDWQQLHWPTHLTQSALALPSKSLVNISTLGSFTQRRQSWKKKVAPELCTEASCPHWWEWCLMLVFPFTASRCLSLLAWNTHRTLRANDSKETQVCASYQQTSTSISYFLLGGLVLGIPAKLLCGGFAGALAQSFSYPFDVTRRRMQLAMMNPETAKFG